MHSNQKTISKSLKNDLILLAVVLLIGALLYLAFKLIKPHDGAKAIITVDGKVYKELSLNEDTSLTVSTELGTNVVIVKNGEIYVESADCPDKICVNHAHINKTNETIVCLPHKMVITIEGNEEETIDSVAE